MNKEDKHKLIERLADLEHQQWQHWTRYFIDNLGVDNLSRWIRQIETPYSELSEEEKEVDRVWARKVLHEVLNHD